MGGAILVGRHAAGQIESPVKSGIGVETGQTGDFRRRLVGFGEQPGGPDRLTAGVHL